MRPLEEVLIQNENESRFSPRALDAMLALKVAVAYDRRLLTSESRQPGRFVLAISPEVVCQIEVADGDPASFWCHFSAQSRANQWTTIFTVNADHLSPSLRNFSSPKVAIEWIVHTLEVISGPKS